MDRGPWWAIVHGVTKSQTRLSNSAHNQKVKKETVKYVSRELKDLKDERIKSQKISELKCTLIPICPALCDPMNYSPPGSPSMEFSQQEYWGGLTLPTAEDLPDPGIKPKSLVSSALTDGFFTIAQLGSPLELILKSRNFSLKSSIQQGERKTSNKTNQEKRKSKHISREIRKQRKLFKS